MGRSRRKKKGSLRARALLGSLLLSVLNIVVGIVLGDVTLL